LAEYIYLRMAGRFQLEEMVGGDWRGTGRWRERNRDSEMERGDRRGRGKILKKIKRCLRGSEAGCLLQEELDQFLR
jgi:hypothetical protein